VQARLYLVGKCAGCRLQLNVLSTGGGPLVYLFDDVSGLQFLADTGASCSVLPVSSSSPPHGPELYASSGQRIPTWGTSSRNLAFGGHTFTFTFILAAVEKPILGADFLSEFKLLVDPFNRNVIFASSLKPIITCKKMSHSTPFLAALSKQSEAAKKF
jgi:hypothetical protein